MAAVETIRFYFSFRSPYAWLAYIVHDASRIAKEYGLPPMTWDGDVDTDWMRPHAAYVFAANQGRGDAFALTVFRARICEERNVGADDVLRDVAKQCGLDPEAVVRAADEFFAWRDQKFWGNDRLEWLIREIQRENGVNVPDLVADPMARPFA